MSWSPQNDAAPPGEVEKRTATKRNELNHLPVVKKRGQLSNRPPCIRRYLPILFRCQRRFIRDGFR